MMDFDRGRLVDMFVDSYINSCASTFLLIADSVHGVSFAGRKEALNYDFQGQRSVRYEAKRMGFSCVQNGVVGSAIFPCSLDLNERAFKAALEGVQ
jgi:hypothetical protein